MDAFYASVEQRDNPELCGKPLAVGHAEERGVVAAASYEARRYGVHSAMSSQKAKRLCPELIFVPGRMNVYKAVSRQIHDIFHTYTDIIEPLSLDEAFLDVTENKAGFSLAIDIAKDIKKRIRKELGLIASAGVSYNKFLTKIASDGLCAACNVTLQAVPCLLLLLFFRFCSLFHPFHGRLEAITPVVKFIKSVLVCVQCLVVTLAVELGWSCYHRTGTSR